MAQFNAIQDIVWDGRNTFRGDEHLKTSETKHKIRKPTKHIDNNPLNMNNYIFAIMYYLQLQCLNDLNCRTHATDLGGFVKVIYIFFIEHF